MTIKEVDDLGIKSLRSQIKKSVDKEEDVEVLNRLISVLESGNLLDRLEAKLKTDQDAKKMYHHLAKVIVNLPGSLEDKEKFIDGYEKGYVNTEKLLTKNRQIPLSEIVPDQFAYTVFNELKDISAVGVGSGEFSLAALSPDIKSVGQRGGGGDLIIKGIKVELKGAKESGGRFHDAKKAQYDMSSIQRVLMKYYPEFFAAKSDTTEAKKSVTAIDWVSGRDKKQVTPAQKKEVAETIAKSTFKHIKNHSKVIEALRSGTESDIRRAWSEASYENYKNYAKFDVMVIIDFSSNTSLCFDQFTDVEADLKVDSIQLWGAEMTAVPKIRLKSSVSSTKTSKAGTAIKSQSQKAEPVKPIKARFEPKPADIGRSQR